MLTLRRGTVVSTDPLTVQVGGEERPAWADPGLMEAPREGDEVLVNTASLDLGLGSGGFDVIHANLTRGLEDGAEAVGMGGGGEKAPHVMKLNYTSLQHAVEPAEAGFEEGDWRPARETPVLVLFLHGQLAPAAWAAAQSAEGIRLGFVQTPGGALPGGLSRDVAELRRRGLLAGHVTAGPSYGGEHEAISVTGALHAAERLDWDAIIAGPGPGILGSATRYGHGGMAALDTAHAALALGLPTVVSPRLSSADPRPRHCGLSHHTEAVLRLLLASVRVAAPAGFDSVTELRQACGDRHFVAEMDVAAALRAYSESGLPSRTMDRGISDDPDFFAAALAGGKLLGEMAA